MPDNVAMKIDKNLFEKQKLFVKDKFKEWAKYEKDS